MTRKEKRMLRAADVGSQWNPYEARYEGQWIHHVHNSARSQLAQATRHLLHANSSGLGKTRNGKVKTTLA